MANNKYVMKQTVVQLNQPFHLYTKLLVLLSVCSVAFLMYLYFRLNVGNVAMVTHSFFAFGKSMMNVSVTRGMVNSETSDQDIADTVGKVIVTAGDASIENTKADVNRSTLSSALSTVVHREWSMADETYSPRSNGIQSLVDIPTNFNFSHTERHIKYYILWFNPANWLQIRNKKLKLDTCEYNNCQLTENKQMLANSSAVIFGITFQNMGTSPPVTSSQRDPNQIWIYHTLEAPINHIYNHEYKNPSWHNTMNWSMTFDLDSDVFAPYGTIKTKQNFSEPDYDKIFNMKTKMAVWLVSDCRSKSRRNEFVTALQNAGLSVDIFGRCGKNGTYKGEIRDLTKHYKFYLSMENSFCKYYVTEKVITRYEEDTILVIRGGADYSKLLPNSETYVNAAMFVNVTSLARHLMDLAVNRERYIKMLKKKSQYYTLNIGDFGNPYSICELCRKLNQNGGRRKVISDLVGEVQRLGRCVNPNDIIIK